MFAAEYGRHECVPILVANGADVNRASSVSVCMEVVINLVQFLFHTYLWLLNRHSDEQDAQTALLLAAERGHHVCVAVLLANG